MTLDELICLEIGEILKSPLLRQSVLSHARHLFNGDNPVSGCDNSVHYYFLRLQKEGIETQQKLLNMKYQLKPGIFIVHNGQSYNSSTMTDEIAEEYLSRFPKAIGNFIVKEDAPAPAEAPTEKKPRAKKSK